MGTAVTAGLLLEILEFVVITQGRGLEDPFCHFVCEMSQVRDSFAKCL